MLVTDSDLSSTVRCDGFCGDDLHGAATVDVVAGEHIGTWHEPQYHWGITGIEAKSPEHGQYCLTCAQELGFDIQQPAGQRDIAEVNTYLTPSNIASFLAGALGSGILFSILAV